MGEQKCIDILYKILAKNQIGEDTPEDWIKALGACQRMITLKLEGE